MQVFLPYNDLKQSVSCLDNSRLGNQVYREGLTLIKGGWPNHPASVMWRGYEKYLALYCLYGLEELKNRGRNYPHHEITFENFFNTFPDNGLPPWLGDDRLHLSHRSNLLKKDFFYYSRFGWEYDIDTEYFWPSQSEDYKNGTLSIK